MTPSTGREWRPIWENEGKKFIVPTKPICDST